MHALVRMEALAVLVVVLLSRGVTEGLVLNKCDLMQRLNQTLDPSVLDRINEVAKIVCLAELTSGFNTSAVRQIPAPRGDRKPRSIDLVPELSPSPSNESLLFNPEANQTEPSSPSPSFIPPVSNSSLGVGGAGGHPGAGGHSGAGGRPGAGGHPGAGGRPGAGGPPGGHPGAGGPPGGRPGAGGPPGAGGRPGAGGPPGAGGRKPRSPRPAQGSFKPFASPAPHNESEESHEQGFVGNQTENSRPSPSFIPPVSNPAPGASGRPGAGGRPEAGGRPGPGGRKPRSPRPAQGSFKPFASPAPHNESEESHEQGFVGNQTENSRPAPSFIPPVSNAAPGASGRPGAGGRPEAGGRPGPGGRKPRSPRPAQGSFKPFASPAPHNESEESHEQGFVGNQTESSRPSPSFVPPVSNGAPGAGGVSGRPGAGGRPEAGGRPGAGGRRPRSLNPFASPPPHSESDVSRPAPSFAAPVSNFPFGAFGAGSRPAAGGPPGAGGRRPRSPKREHHLGSHQLGDSSRPFNKSGEHGDGVWTLYGLFQLADSVACVSGSKPSLNLCGLSCDKLIDDDITDDIACVGTIINKMMTNGNVHSEASELTKKMYDLIHQQSCANLVGSQYFSACPQ